jgi:sulfatase modifying factor 1
MKTTAVTVLTFVLSCISTNVVADMFGSDADQFEIDFVTINDPGNAADTTGNPSLAGSVDYVYRIGKFEISRDIVTKANIEGGLEITLSTMGFVHGGARPDMPATGVSWNEAARFVNWLNTSHGSPPAYKFSTQPGDVEYDANANILLWNSGDPGFDSGNLFRNTLARYFLPSVDEWYKAAYYDLSANGGVGGYRNFPTGSDSAPTPVESGDDPGTAVYLQTDIGQGPADITQAGGLSPYGLMALGGNVGEWEETEFDLVNDSGFSDRSARGGIWSGDASFLSASARVALDDPSDGRSYVSFRIAGIPGPILLGDMNGDGAVDGLDVDPFVGLVTGGTYQAEGDMNEDRAVNGLDVDPFVAAVVGGGTHQIPEPSTLLLAFVALGVVAGWRKWNRAA